MVEVGDDPVDAGADEAVRGQFVEDVLVLALAVGDHGREQHDAAAFRQCQCLVDHLADGLGVEGLAMGGTARLPDAGEQQAQVIVDLGDRADGRAGVVGGRLLFDGDRRREALDMVDVRLLHYGQELARISREGLHVAPLSLRVQGVEREGGLAGSGQPRDDHEPVPRNIEIDVLQVVGARAAHRDRGH